MKPILLMQGPIATRSGYGDHMRDIAKCIIELYNDKDITPETKQALQERISVLEKKVLDKQGMEKLREDKIFDLFDKSFEKDIQKNPELMVSRFAGFIELEKLASEKASKATGKDKAYWEKISDMYRT